MFLFSFLFGDGVTTPSAASDSLPWCVLFVGDFGLKDWVMDGTANDATVATAWATVGAAMGTLAEIVGVVVGTVVGVALGTGPTTILPDNSIG